MKNIFTLALLGSALWLILFFPKPSMAYIDPGSGFILLQVLIASAIGGFFAFKRFWIKLLQRIHILKADETSDEEENTSENK